MGTDFDTALAEISALQQRFWPTQVKREVNYPIPGRGMVDYLRHWAATRPQTIAIAFYGREVSYAEYDDLSDRFAAWLSGHGVRAGDAVGVALGNCPQFHVAMLGILKLGAVHVPVNPMLREHELAHELSDADVSVVLTHQTLVPLAVLPREVVNAC